ncbi:MAG: MerR family DNA-binding protein, partial [Euryarchaeota archaeon]|nr:MerR family DNA-binding protein [Euryarchaeota archaeon]
MDRLARSHRPCIAGPCHRSDSAGSNGRENAPESGHSGRCKRKGREKRNDGEQGESERDRKQCGRRPPPPPESPVVDARPSAAVKAIAQARIAELHRRIAALEGMARSLERLSAECCGDERPDCPILDDLA